MSSVTLNKVEPEVKCSVKNTAKTRKVIVNCISLRTECLLRKEKIQWECWLKKKFTIADTLIGRLLESVGSRNKGKSVGREEDVLSTLKDQFSNYLHTITHHMNISNGWLHSMTMLVFYATKTKHFKWLIPTVSKHGDRGKTVVAVSKLCYFRDWI